MTIRQHVDLRSCPSRRISRSLTRSRSPARQWTTRPRLSTRVLARQRERARRLQDRFTKL